MVSLQFLALDLEARAERPITIAAFFKGELLRLRRKAQAWEEDTLELKDKTNVRGLHSPFVR